jgi:hypothetical protein
MTILELANKKAKELKDRTEAAKDKSKKVDCWSKEEMNRRNKLWEDALKLLQPLGNKTFSGCKLTFISDVIGGGGFVAELYVELPGMTFPKLFKTFTIDTKIRSVEWHDEGEIYYVLRVSQPYEWVHSACNDAQFVCEPLGMKAFQEWMASSLLTIRICAKWKQPV